MIQRSFFKTGISPLEVKHLEAGLPKRVTCLVYGPPKSGKTFFAGTFPKPLFLNTDKGLTSVRKSKAAYVDLFNWQDCLWVGQEALWGPYETIVLDDITEAGQLALADAVGEKENPTIREWGMAIERVTQLVKTLVDIPRHIVVTAQETIDKDEELGRMVGQPDVPGKTSLARKLGKYFDVVFHLQLGLNKATGQKQRMLLTESDGMFYAGDRLGGLEKLETPSFTGLWAKWMKG